MRHEANLQPILDLLEAHRQKPLTLLAIDGHSAAGKTTLARAICGAASNAAIVHMDDFYRVMPPDERERLDAAEAYRLYYDWERVEAQVLTPLRRGETARYQRYDWQANRLGDWCAVEANGVVIVEGCYAARPELKGYYDVIVLVEAPAAVRARRQAERADASQAWLNRWDAAETYYMTRIQPRSYAHWVIAAS